MHRRGVLVRPAVLHALRPSPPAAIPSRYFSAGGRMSSTWFITGASRGIGLQFVKQLTTDPKNIVIASCRNPDGATELGRLNGSAMGKLHIVKLDVTNEATVKAAAAETAEIVSDAGLDYLLNNAGISLGNDTAFNMKLSDFKATLDSNVIGPILTAQAFLPLLQKGNRKVIMNMTSGLSSIGIKFGPGSASYSISKTALNMLTYKQAAARPDFICLAVDPGWVKTNMGGPHARLDPPDSVTPILEMLMRATKADSGKFIGYNGKEKPW